MAVDYPVLEIFPALQSALNTHNIVILQAPPGAGKSTVLPLKLMSEGWLKGKKMIMLEPRRLAAKAVAERMAYLLQDDVGGKVGYRIRFDSRVTDETQIEVVTEGILTRMIQSDNSLEDTGLIIFDEFHERSLHADLALALALQIQQVLREDLRILIMSATLDGDLFSKILGGAPVITSEGRQFPVAIRYAHQPQEGPVAINVARVIRKALQEEPMGDILVFFPGAGEIQRTFELLMEAGIGAVIHPLYGDLSFKSQQEAILPDRTGRRKVVLATSIAETSLTIEGIRIVIDAGLSRVPRFDPRSGLTRLETIRVTKDAAEQRAGRAGRLGPGICYRMWTEGMQLSLVPAKKPEILEADLAPAMLELIHWGIKDIKDLTWITSPPPGTVSQAMELLQQLEAIDERGITPRGKMMLKMPTHPRIAHLLMEAQGMQDGNMIALATDIASVLEERDPMAKGSSADFTLRIEMLRKWRGKERVNGDRNVLDRIARLASHWRRILKVTEDNRMPDHAAIGLLLMAAYPERIAQQQGRHSERYKLVNGKTVNLPSHDPLIQEEWICAAQLDAGSGEGKIFMAAPVHKQDLYNFAREEENVKWDDKRNMVVARLEKRIGTLLLESRPLADIPEDRRIDVLCEVVRENGLKILSWNETTEQLVNRILSLRKWRGQEWPDVSFSKLLEGLREWLPPYLINITKQSALERLDMHTIIMTMVPWDLQGKLETFAPSRVEVPSGSHIKVQYFDDGRSPVMEVRLQEMFGQPETPSVNEGKVKVILHLLSPGFKPVQVTQDLRSFWNSTYHEVRKELRVRYPKHHWPDDPWTAEAVRGAKRR